MKFIDLTGMHFGDLTVIRKDEDKKAGEIFWVCECNCGKIKSIRGNDLRQGKIVSCGCYSAKNASRLKTTHGDSKTGRRSRLYVIWAGMKRRCNSMSPQEKDYKHYRGKGIKVCAEWERYEGFKQWATSNGYKDCLVIDRIDPDKDYCPENCQWITAKENAQKCSFAKLNMEKAGVLKKLKGKAEAKDLSVLVGVSPGTIRKIWTGDLWS